jgi:transposase
MKVPLSNYEDLYENKKGHKIKCYRTKVKAYGKLMRIVVEHNNDSHKKQFENYKKAKERFLNEVKSAKESLSLTKKGRKPTEEGVRNRISDVIPKKWRSVFKFHVGTTLENALDVVGWVVNEKEKQLQRSFGKTIIFSTNDNMSSEDMVRTYKELYKIEEDFKFLKDNVLIPVTPINHRNDLPIKVHIFLCVIGLLFYRYMLLKLKNEGATISELVEALEEIKIGVVLPKEQKKVYHVVEEMEPSESKIFSILRMDRYVKK